MATGNTSGTEAEGNIKGHDLNMTETDVAKMIAFLSKHGLNDQLKLKVSFNLENHTHDVTGNIPTYQRPRLPIFSGDAKSETSFDVWKFEVKCLLRENLYPELIIVQCMRNSLKNQARNSLLTLPESATPLKILEKLEGIYGNVYSNETLLQSFYTMKLEEGQSVADYGMKLEGILQKAYDKGKLTSEVRAIELELQISVASKPTATVTHQPVIAASDMSELIQKLDAFNERLDHFEGELKKVKDSQSDDQQNKQNTRPRGSGNYWNYRSTQRGRYNNYRVSDHVLKLMKPVPVVIDLEEFELSVSVAGGSKLPYICYVEVKVHIPFLQGEPFYVPMLVVPRSDYTEKVPVIVGTNILRLGMELVHCPGDNISIPKQVVSVKGRGKQKVPVRICNITAKPVVIKPKTVLCELSGVTVVRDGFDDQTFSNSETINEGKESLEELGINVREDLPDSTKDATSQRWIAELADYDFSLVYRNGKSNVDADSLSSIEYYHQELFSDADKAICDAILVSSSCPPAESILMSQTLEEQKKNEDIAKALEFKGAGQKPTKREIGKQPLGVDRDVTQGKCQESYASQLEKRLQYAYKTAAKVAEKTSRRQKTRYDLKLKNSVLKKGDRVLLKNIHMKGRQCWQTVGEPYIVVSQPDTNIPVFVIRLEYDKSKSKTRTVHRNLLLPIYLLVPHSKKERNSKCTSESNRVDDETQILESVKDTECTGSVHEYSDESDSDSDDALTPFVQPGRYKAISNSSLNPSAEEFSPLISIASGFQRNQTHNSDTLNLNNGTGNANSTSGTNTGLSSGHIEETLNTNSSFMHEQSSLIAQNSDISNEVGSVPESTHVPVEQSNEPVYVVHLDR
ncbi:unnamed protein product [Mytilus coruscus]|uniref:Paraneoplastic antigen Ma-like C-terminal domain-containing protein n=1 Tax=Mytilus coruscus TaxID=42192 RepID=A0A6J8C4G2_MYTCO|nr:unnamed protein product [Mytilus coruscus]